MTEAVDIYSSYVSIPSLSGLWTVCPDLVLVIYLGLFTLSTRSTCHSSLDSVAKFSVTLRAGHDGLLSGWYCSFNTHYGDSNPVV